MTRGHPKKGSLQKKNDGHGYKNVNSVNSCCLQIYRAYSVSFNSPNAGKVFWRWILKDCLWKEKKNVVVLCSRTPQPWNKGDIYTS